MASMKLPLLLSRQCAKDCQARQIAIAPMNKRRAISWHPTSSRMNRRKRLRKARKKKGARFAVKSEAIKRPRIQLKQQIQPRSLSDSCSSSRPGQLMMNRRSSTEVSMGERENHPWTTREELFLLEPFATGPDAQDVKFKFTNCKAGYFKAAANAMNEHFGCVGWVPLTDRRIRSKFRHFGIRYQSYAKKGSPNFDQVPTKPHERVEYYIALHGAIFVERSSSSLTCSRSPSASSVGASRQRKTRHIPVKADDEADDIYTAGAIMKKHCGDDDLAFYWYLKALHDPVVLKGFWLTEDAERKTYLDNLLPTLKNQWGV